MDFGRVPELSLSQVNFKLPKEPYWNANILKGDREKTPKIYIGCSRWGCKEWVGKMYPNGTREANFLDEYIKHYNCIELNATHYKIYDEVAIKKWADKAKSNDFLFCPKVYNGISHVGSLTGKEFLTDTFLAGIKAFGNHLGPVFLQMNDKFSPAQKAELYDYLQILPKDVSFFLELRHPDWFLEPHLSELLAELEKSKIGFVITDTAGRRDCCHMQLTQTKAFIRFVGNNLHPTDYARIDDWVKRINYWLDNGLTDLYFFMHMHNEILAPELTVYMVDKLNAECGLNVKKPVFAKSLFD